MVEANSSLAPSSQILVVSRCAPESASMESGKTFSGFCPIGYINADAHLGFSEGRGPNFRKEANRYKTKKKNNISHILVITF